MMLKIVGGIVAAGDTEDAGHDDNKGTEGAEDAGKRRATRVTKLAEDTENDGGTGNPGDLSSSSSSPSCPGLFRTQLYKHLFCLTSCSSNGNNNYMWLFIMMLAACSIK